MVSRSEKELFFHWGKHLLDNCVENGFRWTQEGEKPVRKVSRWLRLVRMGRRLEWFGFIWSKAVRSRKSVQVRGKKHHFLL